MDLTRADIEAIRQLDAPTLANAIETFGVRSFAEGYADSDIRCILPGLPRMVGYAATAVMTARERSTLGDASSGMEALYRHVMSLPQPRIVVVKDLDAPNSRGSLWGEVNSTIFSALGCEGVVTDGLVRDLPEVEAIGFRFFASGLAVSHAYVRVVEVASDIDVGGLTVRPGDLLHADIHGVLSIPLDIAAQLPAAAQEVVAREQRLIAWVRSSGFDPEKLPEMQGTY